MGIKQDARQFGANRAPAVRIPYDGSAAVEMTLDAGQSVRTVALHDAGKKGKRACAGEGCVLCAALGAPDVSYVVDVDELDGETGEMRAAALWLRKRELGELGKVLPESGTVTVSGRYTEREGGELRDDGKPWLDLIFVVVEV